MAVFSGTVNEIISLTCMIVQNLGIVVWDLWWTKWLWNRFSPSTSVSPANLHSTNFSIIIITYHPGLVQQASSGRSTQSPTAQMEKKSMIYIVVY
jgi:hypothetical protein